MVFKPLLLFFYLGFLVPILTVEFEFPYVIYQGLTIYLLLAIGWNGGEELANLNLSSVRSIAGFMGVGFVTNVIIGSVPSSPAAQKRGRARFYRSIHHEVAY